MTDLLRLLRKHLNLLDEAVSNRENMRFLDVVCERVTEYFTESGDEVLDEEDVAELITVVNEAAVDDARALLVARAIALALDGVFGAMFALIFRHRGPLQLAPEDPFPVQEVPLKHLLGSSLSTHSRHLELGLDSVPHLRLAPPQLAPFHISLDWTDDALLAPLKTGAVMSLAVTNASLEDYQWTEEERAGQILFFGVVPKDEDQQRHIIIQRLEDAEKAGAHLLLLPELCLSRALLEDVRKWLRAAPRRLRLLVAGSAHLEHEGRRLNRSVLFLQGNQERTHDKMRPFEFGQPTKTEDISTSPKRVTLHMSGAWSFVSLICKDFITTELAQLLVTLRVRLVLVPAMTPKADAFDGFARQLSSQAQSLVLIANTPGTPDAAPYALIALPSREELLLPELTPPCLLTLRLGYARQLTESLTVT